MIICNLKGGFGNHLLCFSLACILSEKYNIKIKLIDNSIQNDILEQRDDTRKSIHKIVNNMYICDEQSNKNLIHINSTNDYHHILNNLNINYDYIINIIGNDTLDFYISNVNIIKKYLNVIND